MLFSIALMLLVGFTMGELFKFLRLPQFLGMVITGVVLGPYVLNHIHPKILEMSTDLREIALIVILVRVGLNLNIKELKSVGKPALLLSFLPASLEIMGITYIGHLLFGISYLDAAILGSVLAAVSPAVIVPRMIRLLDEGYTKSGVPQLVMTGSSVDDVFVIVVFTSLLGVYETQKLELLNVAMIPISLFLGILLGLSVGVAFGTLCKKFDCNNVVVSLMLLAFGFVFLTFEDLLGYIRISGLVATITLGIGFVESNSKQGEGIKNKVGDIWVFAELILFVLVGASVNIHLIDEVGIVSVLLISLGLVFRLFGVVVSLVGTNYRKKEKLFIGISYIPKATVQAAIGAVPLTMGVASGHLILAIAVTSIFYTAPLGAIMIDKYYMKLLSRQ